MVQGLGPDFWNSTGESHAKNMEHETEAGLLQTFAGITLSRGLRHLVHHDHNSTI